MDTSRFKQPFGLEVNVDIVGREWPEQTLAITSQLTSSGLEISENKDELKMLVSHATETANEVARILTLEHITGLECPIQLIVSQFLIRVMKIVAPDACSSEQLVYPLPIDPACADDPRLVVVNKVFGQAINVVSCKLATSICYAPKSTYFDSNGVVGSNSYDEADTKNSSTSDLSSRSNRGSRLSSYPRSVSSRSCSKHCTFSKATSYSSSGSADIDPEAIIANIAHDIFGAGSSDSLESTGSQSEDERIVKTDPWLFAHFTPDPLKGSVLLPLVCMASGLEIYSLLSSALFHRYVWGIHSPIIGLVTSDANAFVHLVIAWLSDDAPHPSVHIAHAARMTTSADELAGVFDLSDSKSAFRLAKCLYNNRSHFFSIPRLAKEHELMVRNDIEACHSLWWRLDQPMPREEDTLSIMSHEVEDVCTPAQRMRIERWRADIAIDGDWSSLVPSSTEMVQSEGLKSRKESANDGFTIWNKIRGLANAFPLNVESSPSPSLVSSKRTESLLSDSSQDGKLCWTNETATQFVTGGIRNEKDYSVADVNKPIHGFMLGRRATTHTIPLEVSNKAQSTSPFLKIVKHYHAATDFAWVKSVMGRMTSVGKIMGNVTTFVEALDAVTGNAADTAELSDAASHVLLDNLDSLLRMHTDILVGLDRPDGAVDDQTDWRAHWDRLFIMLFHGHSPRREHHCSDGAHITSSTDARLSVALSPILDLPVHDFGKLVLDSHGQAWANIRNAHQLRSELDLLNRHSLLVEDFVRRSIGTLKRESSAFKRQYQRRLSRIGHQRSQVFKRFLTDLHKPVENAVNGTFDALRDYITFTPNTMSPLDMVSDIMKEPQDVTCSAVGFVHIPNIFESAASSRAFNVLRLPLTAPDDFVDRKGGCRHDTERPESQDDATNLFRMSKCLSYDVELAASSLKDNHIRRYLSESMDVQQLRSLSQGETLGHQDIESASRKREIMHHPPKAHASAIFRRTCEKDLALLLVLCEHKKWRVEFAPGSVYRSRLSAIAAVKHWAALGIYEVPVFSVLTSGPIAIVTVTYAEKIQQKDPRKRARGAQLDVFQASNVHILERNATSFNIRTLIGFLGYATFLIRLRTEIIPHVYQQFCDSKPRILELLRKAERAHACDFWKANAMEIKDTVDKILVNL